jgi:hypothetical protein
LNKAFVCNGNNDCLEDDRSDESKTACIEIESMNEIK